MKISDLLRGKELPRRRRGDDAGRRDRARAARELAENDIGALVVVDGDEVLGIVSERDVVRRLHEWGDTPARQRGQRRS